MWQATNKNEDMEQISKMAYKYLATSQILRRLNNKSKIFSLNDEKALGPNGFNAHFFTVGVVCCLRGRDSCQDTIKCFFESRKLYWNDGLD